MIDDYQRVEGEDYALFRLDVEPAFDCDPFVSMFFVANVCAVNDANEINEVDGEAFQVSSSLTAFP